MPSAILSTFINTPLQRGVARRRSTRNRFNGFDGTRKTVETVFASMLSPGTPLKRGVNEKGFGRNVKSVKSLC